MADPVRQPDIVSPPAAKAPPAAPKAVAPAAKQAQAKPKEAPQKQTGKPRLASLNTNLGRSGVRQESALPVKKVAPKPAPGAKPHQEPRRRQVQNRQHLRQRDRLAHQLLQHQQSGLNLLRKRQHQEQSPTILLLRTSVWDVDSVLTSARRKSMPLVTSSMETFRKAGSGVILIRMPVFPVLPVFLQMNVLREH